LLVADSTAVTAAGYPATQACRPSPLAIRRRCCHRCQLPSPFFAIAAVQLMSLNHVHSRDLAPRQDQNIPGLCTFPIKKMDINDPKAKISIKRLKKDEPRNGRQGAKHTYCAVIALREKM
jgi:hypothetical protein